MTIKQEINKLKSKHGLTSKKVAELIGISIGNFRNKQSDKNLKENFNDNHLKQLKQKL
jgi:DNA-binding XRE family transcriptional regulator